MTLAVLQKFIIWTFVVAISFVVVTGCIVTCLRVLDCRPEAVALMVDCIKLAVELCVVTEVAGLTVRVDGGKVSADISAGGGCVRRVNEWVAFPVYRVARAANLVVVAEFVYLIVIAEELFAVLVCVRSRPVMNILTEIGTMN